MNFEMMKVVTFSCRSRYTSLFFFLGADMYYFEKRKLRVMLSRELVWSAVCNISQALVENQ